MSTLLSLRSCLAVPLLLVALNACATQIELRMAQQQEQWGREAASQGDWAQAMRNYADAAGNVELGHGDLAWQAQLHYEAGRAASAACRHDAAVFHFRSAIALAKQDGASGALGSKALDALAAIEARPANDVRPAPPPAGIEPAPENHSRTKKCRPIQ